MPSASTIRVLLADDHRIMRYTLRSVLKQHPDIEVVDEATDGEEAVLKANECEPDIVLMDINMPNLDGIAATRRIKASCPRMAVVGLSVDDGGNSASDMLRAGAVAVVQKDRAIEDLYDAVQRAFASLPDITASPSIAVGPSDIGSSIDLASQPIYLAERFTHAPNPTTSMPDL
jgi:DNA-binding NarL/FixJ family response regulator